MQILGRQIQFEPAGEVIQVTGTLLCPGTFTGLDGEPVTFDKDAISDIKEHIEGNVPLKVTHFSDKIVGYATHFSYDEESGELKFKGYVFDPEAIRKITQDGYDHISGEFDLDVTDGNVVVGGVLKAIAFVTNPAVPSANVEEAKPVALSRGDGMSGQDRPSKDEFLGFIEGRLVEAGVPKDVVQKVMDVLKEVIKVPYPYPYPAPKAEELEAKLAEKDKEIERLTAELEQYRAKFTELKEQEFKALAEELKNMGIKEPEAIVEGIEDVEQRIAILQRVKENVALSSTAKSEEVEAKEEKSEAAQLAEDFGLSEEEVKEIFGLGGE